MTPFIRCSTCGQPITRNAVVKLGDEWIHSDDSVVISGTGRVLSTTTYDHSATPDIIDLDGPEKKSQQSLVSGEPIRYVDNRPIEAVAREAPDDIGSTPTTHTHQEQ